MTDKTLALRERERPPTIFRFENFAEVERAAKLVAESSIAPKAYYRKPGDIMVAWQLGAEVGLSPMQALAGIAVINGRASLYGDVFLAVAMQHPDFVELQEMSAEEIRQAGVAKATVVRRNRKPVVRTFSIDNAKKAGLWTKSGPWTQYPERMLQMRARTFAVRDAFPDALAGMISDDEAADYNPPVSGPIVEGHAQLANGAQTFGFKRRAEVDTSPTVELADVDEHSRPLQDLLGRISMADDMEGLHACKPNGDLEADERELAKAVWLAKRNELSVGELESEPDTAEQGSVEPATED